MSNMDPEKKLEILREWLYLRIDGELSYQLKHSFSTYIHRYYSHLIPGTINYAKAQATHCFYCKQPFVVFDPTPDNMHPLMITVDHFQPLSGDEKTTKFVICHKICNECKHDSSAAAYVKKITKACLNNRTLFGLSGHSLKTLLDQVTVIYNDSLLGTGPRVYYLKLEERKPNPAKVYGRRKGILNLK